MGNLNYGEYDEETAAQEKEEASAGGAKFWKPKVGRNVIRILPPAVGQKKLFRSVYQHWIEMVKRSVTCARIEAKKPCAVCMKVDELKKSKLKIDQDMASELFAKRQVFVNIIDRSDAAAGVQVFRCGKTIHEQLLALRTDEEAGANYSHPLTGNDIVIERVGTGKNDTKYKVMLGKQKPLGPDDNVMQEWIDMQHNLDQIAKLPTLDEVKQLLSGEMPDSSSDGDSSAPKGGKANGARKGRTAEDDVIDVEAEES